MRTLAIRVLVLLLSMAGCSDESGDGQRGGDAATEPDGGGASPGMADDGGTEPAPADAEAAAGTGGSGASGGSGGAGLPFVSVWKTDNAGISEDDQITLPLVTSGDYDFTVDWGDGNEDSVASWNDAAATHTYDSPGTYEVSVTGTISGWTFYPSGDWEISVSGVCVESMG